MTRTGILAAARGMMMAAVAVMAIPALAQHDATAGIHPAHIYPPIEAAKHDIDKALAEARRTHKRVILDFGGDWCGDCQVLNIYFHQSPNAELLEKHFILVDVNIGRIDANGDIAKRYGVPMKGVPALAVIDGHGKVIYAQANNQFSDMRHMDAASVTEFLNTWKH
ncbi:MAG: thioredoxin family protein [Acidobacteriota bacterium]